MAASKTITIPDYVQDIFRTGLEYDGCHVKIKAKLDPKIYLACSKILQALGGKWRGGRTQATVFDIEAQPLIEAALGNGKVENRRTVLQAFFTKPVLALRMLQMLDLTRDDLLFEPSAGEGALIMPILTGQVTLPRMIVMTEIDERHHAKLLDLVDRLKISNPDYPAAALCDDFLTQTIDYRPTTVVMNPPFTEGRCSFHIQRAYEVLAPGGRMVAIAGESEFNSGKTGRTMLQDWLQDVGAVVEPVPENSFEYTNARARLVYITKP